MRLSSEWFTKHPLSQERKVQVISLLNFFRGDNGNCSIIIDNDKTNEINNINVTREILNEFEDLIGKDNITYKEE